MDGLNYKYLAPAFLTACLMASGQILFSLGARGISVQSWQTFLHSTLTNWVLVCAIALYAVTILIWIFTLKHLPLSVAYPITACAYIITPLLAFFLLNDPLPGKIIVGSFFIVVGMIIIYN